MNYRPLTLSVFLIASACAVTSVTVDPSAPKSASDARDRVTPPLGSSAELSAYDLAAFEPLPDLEPSTHDGLHNVYHLSDNIISGSEPEGRVAYQRLAEMGIATVLSVDGKAPDANLAAEFGLRYVHVPIRYKGIEQHEVLAIAKTFRELDGPFFVHCFHGKHRGPAAAAIGRVVLDGAPREDAIAEMRQWCGTSGKYEGLYATIAFGALPSVAQTEAFAFDFPTEHRFAGFRHTMVDIARSWDTIAALSDRDWQPNPEHPDASARNEARKMARAFGQAIELETDQGNPADFLDQLSDSKRDAELLAELLDQHFRGDTNAGERARQTAAGIRATCTACHADYRND